MSPQRVPRPTDAVGLRARWGGSGLRERLDQPIGRANQLTRRTLKSFPVRVWRHFLQHNGFLLAASISYQSLFSIFAALYFAFALAGAWIGPRREIVAALIAVIDTYVPDLVATDGVVSPSAVEAIARDSGGVLAVTGVVAFVVAVWTAIGFVTFTRRAVRDIFVLPYDARNFFLLKARDLVAALLFGAALVVGAGLSTFATGALNDVLEALGIGDSATWAQVLGRALSVVVAFAIASAAMAGLFRFLSGTSLPWRAIWPGALLAGAGLLVLQLGAGTLLTYTPSNPLLVTFSVFVGLLLWFRLNGVVILVAASWIAISAADHEIPLAQVSDAERRRRELEALAVAAEVQLRRRLAERETAPWWKRGSAERRVRVARDELAQARAAAVPPEEEPRLLAID